METTDPKQPGHPVVWARAADLVLLLTILVPFFLFNCLLAFTFHRMGVTHQFNVIFDTDLATRLSCFATGWGGFGRNPAHPNLCNLINPAVRIVGAALSDVSGHTNGVPLREYVSLLVAPVAGLIQLTVLFLALRCLRLPRLSSLLIIVLDAASFSYMIFATVPDHFVLGGLAITLSLYAAVKTLTARKAYPWLWGLAGFLAIAITITNAVPFGILLLLSYCSVFGWRRGLIKTAVMCVCVAAVNFGMEVGMARVYHTPPESPSQITGWAGQYFRKRPLENLMSFPLAIGSAVAPSGIATKPNTMMTKGARYAFQTEIVPPSAHLSFALAEELLFLLGVVAGLALALGKNDGILRPLGVGCGLTLILNGLLHAFWGGDYFLFSQHWSAAAFLMAGIIVLFLPRRIIPAFNILLAVMIVVALANNLTLIREILRLLNG